LAVSQKITALVLSGAMMMMVGAGAGARPVAHKASAIQPTEHVSAGINNRPPLAPAGAAGIRAAQGIADVDAWFISGLAVAGTVAAVLLADEDGNESTSSTE